ncbi:MAG TPA: response regulator transcription factor [Candidatus Acidoferrales bacterium]|jgi:DNA-binding NarL/FixJ family response regulator|nr:response regulator transcription factor [Candidatus Acidoferrales bacterium]
MMQGNKEEKRGVTGRSPFDSPEMEKPSPRPYRVVIVDDHPVVRRGLRALFDDRSGIEVCGELTTGLEAVEFVKKNKPDLVIMDLTLPEMNGLDAARAIKQDSPSTQILILSMHFSEELAREVLRAGALGYLLKSDADTELMAAVDHARRRLPFFTSTLARTMAQSFVEGPTPPSADVGPVPGVPLTEREVQVVQLLAEGKSNKEVATVLNVSTRTVESHRNHIMRKMNFTSFSDLVRFAIRASLVNP